MSGIFINELNEKCLALCMCQWTEIFTFMHILIKLLLLLFLMRDWAKDDYRYASSFNFQAKK